MRFRDALIGVLTKSAKFILNTDVQSLASINRVISTPKKTQKY